MKISFNDLKKNTEEGEKIGNLNNFRENFSDLGKVHPRNQLNDLNLLDWIKHTKTVHNFDKKAPIDEFKAKHPATFEEELPFYYIEFFTKKNDVVFDPFLGSGTTSIASSLLGRRSIGIELNDKFIEIIKKRLEIHNINPKNHRILKGDSFRLLRSGEFKAYLEKKGIEIQFTITSPPYHDILKYYNNKKNEENHSFHNYGENPYNLEKIESYQQYLEVLIEIFKIIYKLMKNQSYLLINAMNYYDKVLFKNNKFGRQITYFAWDLAYGLSKTDWIPCGEQIWVYPNRKLYPYGSPYVYLANIIHSYNLIFYKDINKK